MKLFECIIDDGKNVFKALTAATSKKELLNAYGGNGEFIRIKDITSEYFTDESVERLDADLSRTGWGAGERKILCALLEQHIQTIK